MLTVTGIQKAKPTDKQYRMPDERELVLLVRPNGSKLWQLRFRHEGKEKSASLGQYPDVSPSDARAKRDAGREHCGALIYSLEENALVLSSIKNELLYRLSYTD